MQLNLREALPLYRGCDRFAQNSMKNLLGEPLARWWFLKYIFSLLYTFKLFLLFIVLLFCPKKLRPCNHFAEATIGQVRFA
jgi:hypothetical protein